LNKETPFIKRIVGVEGDTLITTLGDIAAHLQGDQLAAHDDSAKRTWHIPPKHVFVLSDNLPGGDDSLSWGPVPRRNVLGLVLMRLPNKLSEDHL
jgi:signal peptidase I